jgi:hypothetical protein
VKWDCGAEPAAHGVNRASVSARAAALIAQLYQRCAYTPPASMRGLRHDPDESPPGARGISRDGKELRPQFLFQIRAYRPRTVCHSRMIHS